MPEPLLTEPPRRAPAHGEQTPKDGRAAVVWTLALGLLCWLLLFWLAFDMGHPIAQLTMPMSTEWTEVNLVAVATMWAVMMVAMMLPSALPMIRTFAVLSAKRGERLHSQIFIAAYLVVWVAFSIAATGVQWTLQAAGRLNPMIVSTSATLNIALLVIAGIYQFSSLKRVCLAKCRTPIVFLLAEWRPGASGAFQMGLRHGLFCVGCCWVLMALLFVGGAMNLAWIASLSVAVALEKLVPGGERLSHWLGAALIAAGTVRVLALMI